VYVAPLSTVRVYGTCLGEPSQPRMSESGHLYPPLEMDSLPAQSPVMIGKSHVSQKLARRDYAIGICLLLLVVFLWTTSNFVTQDIFVGGYEKPFLSVPSYLRCPSWLAHCHTTQHHVSHNKHIFAIPSTVPNKELYSTTISWWLQPNS